MYSISVPSITDEQKDRWKADGRGEAREKGKKASSTHPIIRVNSLGTQMEKSRNKRLRIPCNSRSNSTSDLSASKWVIISRVNQSRSKLRQPSGKIGPIGR